MLDKQAKKIYPIKLRNNKKIGKEVPIICT